MQFKNLSRCRRFESKNGTGSILEFIEHYKKGGTHETASKKFGYSISQCFRYFQTFVFLDVLPSEAVTKFYFINSQEREYETVKDSISERTKHLHKHNVLIGEFASPKELERIGA